MDIRKGYFIVAILLIVLFAAFSKPAAPAVRARIYYDMQLDSLLLHAHELETRSGTVDKGRLLSLFFDCRQAYKRVEFFIDAFDARTAQLLNGPDLLRIDEENPADSMKPHGLQVLESILYADTVNRVELKDEIALFITNVRQLRNDPDRIYYFKDEKIWEGMRLGVYRIISLGVTGFDVPLSYHSLPETRIVLSAVYKTTGFYKKAIGDSLFHRGGALFAQADRYLAAHKDFNRFDRITFIRDHVDPISSWLTVCAGKLGCIDRKQRTPLNAAAANLFSPDIMNLSFFSPNEKYGVTPGRIALGRRLFYDAQLSGDGSRSCASCHRPEKAFTDGLPKAAGLAANSVLQRNTPTLWNAALQTRQFYDSRTETLENQLSAVVHNTEEMNGSLRSSIPKLLADKTYSAQFHNAYPGGEQYINEYNIANAISCYVRSLISLNSRFDKYMRREANDFTAAEKNGFNLFMGKAKCGTCHYAPLFNGLIPPLYDEVESEILGVPAGNAPGAPMDDDAGKSSYTRLPIHKYAFRTSTVRNVALTAPYMHNGVFNTLDEVIDFYNDGGGAGRGIAIPSQTLPAEKLGLTAKEKKDIAAFLHTLTDTSGTSFKYVWLMSLKQ